MRLVSVRVMSALLLAAATGSALPASSAEVSIALPLARTAYQTNEQIDLAVVRSSNSPGAAGEVCARNSP